jgi:hypothetical protein
MLARKPRWQMMGDRALEHIRKHPDIWVLSFRFVYGLRTVMPVAIGLSGYPPGRYLLLNGIGAAVWATALGLPPTTSARCSKACSAASRSTSYGCSAPCWCWACCLWLRRRFPWPSRRAERRAAAEGQEAQAEQAVSQEQPPSQGVTSTNPEAPATGPGARRIPQPQQLPAQGGLQGRAQREQTQRHHRPAQAARRRQSATSIK